MENEVSKKILKMFQNNINERYRKNSYRLNASILSDVLNAITEKELRILTETLISFFYNEKYVLLVTREALDCKTTISVGESEENKLLYKVKIHSDGTPMTIERGV